MERLSERFIEILNEQDFCFEPHEMRDVEKAVKRFKAYEDTGLLPKEIPTALEMAKIYLLTKEIEIYKQASNDGRLIVLPCKVGDTVYAIRQTPWDGKFVRELTALVVGACIRDHQTEIVITTTKDDVYGKTVFLTREEAEEALRRAE